MKLKKDNMIRNLIGEEEIKIFKDAGWVEVQETSMFKSIEENTDKTDGKKNKIK